MDIEVFSLCDFAEDFNGKLVIVGTFDSIMLPQFPANFATCSIASRMRFEVVEGGKHRLKIAILDPNGGNLVPPLEGEFEVKVPSGLDSAVFNFTINISQIQFNAPGKHAVVLFIDGRQVRSVPLLVAQVQG